MNLREIVTQLESCHYECEAGALENNVAFIRLKEISIDPADVGVIEAAIRWREAHDKAYRQDSFLELFECDSLLAAAVDALAAARAAKERGE